MPDPPKPDGGVQPVVFDTPILGRAVCLGELYDQRTGKFLGVQLYPHDKIQETVTDIRHTELTLSLSTTHEEKASLLDINAQLSLDVLGGLVKVSGSASYLDDEKSNSHEFAYALALKMRLNEKRILFAENELGRNVLPVAQEDYIGTKLATHFVSSIVYGGNFIVNLVAKQSELTKEEKVEGKLQASFDKLKGAISLEGSVEAKIKGDFSNMNDKFDLVIHGDVALDKVPINPQDVLDTFPDAASLISDNGGVPLSVTLQPIPPKLYTGSLVYQLDADFVDVVLKAFSMLDDLSSRFLVLQNDAKSVQDYVPELARMTRVVADAYTQDHNKLLHELGKFLRDYQSGTKPGSDSIFYSDVENTSDITGDKVLEEATKMYDKQLDPTHKDKATDQYPSTLAGLENELSRFRDFVFDIQRVRKSIQAATQSVTIKETVEKSVYLSNVEDICRALRIQSKIPLFVMTPMTAKDSNPDIAVIKYLAIIRKYAAYFQDPVNPAYMLYAENPDILVSRLSDGQHKFPNPTGPALVIGQVSDDGTLTWDGKTPPPPPPPPDPTSDLTFPIDHKPSVQKVGELFLSIDPVNGTTSFSIQIRAKSLSSGTIHDSTILFLRCAANNTPFLRFQTTLGIQLQLADSQTASIGNKRDPVAFEKFMATFVQDTKNHVWILYLNDTEVDRVDIGAKQLLPTSAKLQIAYPNNEKWWDGEVYQVKAFAHALTKDSVAAQYAAWQKE